MLTATWIDLRYALKWLRRSPAFTLVAVLSLGIGIGFNTAVFTFIDALLLRPLAVSHPEQLVDVFTSDSDRQPYGTTSYPDFLDLQARNQVFSGLAGYSPSLAAVKAGDRSRMILGEVVTGNYFDLLGVQAAVGRTLVPDDDRTGAPRAAMISYRFWRTGFGADPNVIGRTLLIHGQSYAIVGVAPASFTGSVPVLQPEVWTPVASVADVEPAGKQDVVTSPTGTSRLDRRGQRWIFVKGRLRSGVTAARAAANAGLIMGQLQQTYPKTNEHRDAAIVAGVHIHPDADRALRPIAIGLMGALSLVLLVACANVANMLLARASGRQKEIGIRLAIGASRGRLIRQLLTESLTLAMLGAIAGVTIAGAAVRLISAIPLPVPIDLSLDLHIDPRALVFTFTVATIAGIVAGLVPALRATRPGLVSDLKGEATLATTGRRWTVRDGLVIAQTAITLVLLIAAGLLTRSLGRAQHVDLGFQPKGVVALSIELGLVGYDEPRAVALFDRAAARIAALPGVAAVGRALRQPLALNYNRSTLFFPERSQPGDPGVSVASTWIDEGYLPSLGIPLARGRNFSSADAMGAKRVAIVNEAFVHRFWPGSDGLGKRLKTRDSAGNEYEVVGVTRDYKVETVGEKPTPYVQFALRQRTFTGQVILARTAGDPAAVLAEVRRTVLDLEPNAVFLESETMDEEVAAKLLPARLAAQTLGIVSFVAMALAAVGLYGVVAYAVGRRTREIGIRMALGAAPQRVVSMVMRQGLTLVGAGVAVGVVLSAAAARALSSALYGVSAADAVAWSGAIAVLLAAGAAANYLPASRAARVDPSTALRAQ